MTRRLTRDRAAMPFFVLFAVALAFWQAPGWATADTKIDLHVDPAQFLKSVASVWTPTTDLGDVHASQYSGYLWPMGPFFDVLHVAGIGSWVIERIWLAVLFALAAWGMVRLLDALVGRPRGVVHMVGGAFYLLNPFVVVSVARSSIDLLGYAALPWLLLVTYRGVHTRTGWRGWRSWWWAAAFALILASTGGGVNAALIAWVLVGPLVLALYESATGAVRWRDSIGYLLQVGILGLLTSLWWIVPVLAHVRYGIDFLKYTEQPSTIWATNGATESLRLMGFWNSYSGVGYGITRSLFSDAGTLLFNPLVVGATLLIPAIAIAATIRARRDSYAPLLMCLVLVGVVIMVAGFPNGTPLRGAMVWVYQRFFVLRFMRTNYKVAPLVAVGVGGLLGLAAQQLLARLRLLANRSRRRVGFAAVAGAFTGLIALAGLPLMQGKAIDSQFEYKHIPAAWTEAGRDLNKELPANTRAMVLPGQVYAFYTWGGTGDNILPRLTTRPVAVRYETPYSDLHAAELLTDVDDLVQQRRLVPGQLPPLLRLMGVGAVITGSDDDISRSGAIAPAAAAAVLEQQLGSAARSYGPVRALQPAAGDLGPSVKLPEVRRYDVSSPRGIVHVDPAQDPTIVDGSAQGLEEMAAFGALPARDAIFYAGDLSAAGVRQQAAGGANIVVTDSNQRAVFVPEFTQQNQGAVLAANEPLPTETANLDPFSSSDSNAQTVSVLHGASYVTSPPLGGALQFPEHAPIAAFDGNLATSWIANTSLPLQDAWVQVGFEHPRDVPYVDVYPLRDAFGDITEIDVNGIRHAVGAGWNRIPVNLHDVSAIRVTIDGLKRTDVPVGSFGGFREIRIPGLTVRQLLRPPTVAEHALVGSNLDHDSLTYEFQRMTGDDPFQRNRFGQDSLLNQPYDRGDAEQTIDRIVDPPATRSYRAQAWIYPSTLAQDSALDRLAGYRGSVEFNSSSRFENQPAYRASSAFDGRGGGGWIGIWAHGRAANPWLSWTTRKPLTLSRLVLRHSTVAPRYPTAVQLAWAGGESPPLIVGHDGSVALPHPVSARSFRLTVLAATTPPGTSLNQLAAWAVGIGSISIPGLAVQSVPSRGALRAGCGTVSIDVGGHIVPMRPAGTVQQLDAGQPMQARSCSVPFSIAAGAQEIQATPGVFSVDLLQLRSPAPAALAGSTGGTVVRAGAVGQSTVSGARVSLSRPAWIVLGESFNKGWQASCNGRSLGPSRVIDGYANGWLASPACQDLLFSFGPQSGAQDSYVVSAVSALVLVIFILLGWRRGTELSGEVVRRYRPEPSPGRLPVIVAAAIALALAVPIGAIFALRMGAASAPLLFLVLWLRVERRIVTGIAVLLLAVVVPIVYLLTSPKNLGGYDFAYSVNLIWAHWFGVVAILLLGVVTFKEIVSARCGRSGPPSGEGSFDEAEHDSVGRVEQEVIRS